MIREFVNTEDLMKHYIKNKINTFIKSSHWYNEVLFKDCVKFWEMKEEPRLVEEMQKEKDEEIERLEKARADVLAGLPVKMKNEETGMEAMEATFIWGVLYPEVLSEAPARFPGPDT